MFAKDPADSVADVALARAIGTNDGGYTTPVFEGGAVSETLEALDLQLLEVHGLLPGLAHAQGLDSLLGGALLRFPLAGALAAAKRLARDAHFDRETAPRIAVFLLQGDILWRLVPTCLDEMLECGLCIEAGAFLVKLAKLGTQEAEDETASGTVTTAAINGSDDGFHGAGEVAFAGAATGGFLSAAKDEVVTEAEAGGSGGEGSAADDIGSHARELAFAGIGVMVEKLGGYDHAEDRIAEELEALVGVGVGTRFIEVGGMGHGILDEIRREAGDTQEPGRVTDSVRRSAR